MERSSPTTRFLNPLFFALLVMIASRIAYFNAYRIDSQVAYHVLAVLAGAIQFASIMLVPIIVYPLTYFRGATALERVVASATNLAVWIAIDTYHVSTAFPWAASMYYGVNIGSILFAWNFAWMGVLELVCRRRAKRMGDRVRIVTPLPLIPILLFLLVVFFLSKEGGAAYFNLLLNGYRVLFRN